MENGFDFKTLLPKETKEEYKTGAALSAEYFSPTQLENCIVQNNVLLSSERTPEERRSLENITTTYCLALDAKKRWMSLCPYARKFSFEPEEAGNHMKKLNQILHPVYLKKFVLDKSQKDLIPIRKIKLQVEFLRMTYEDLKKIQETSERDLHLRFHVFLKNFFPRENEMREFFSLYEFETDAMPRDSDRDTVSIVKIKKDDDEDFKEALFKTALYAIKWCTMKLQAGEFTVNLAAVALPGLTSRLGRIKLKLAPGGNYKKISMEIYDIAVWGKTGKEAYEFVNHIGKCIIIPEDL
ncbi:MAG: uncharacterized protein A8A55_2328 [Amphiamblys sp. WSBS2006]|nr:MAG: uncharacterized protein A8A55_2328 [Amphiamblys sp. WSBS2006]